MNKEQQQSKQNNPVPAADFLISRDNYSKILLVRRRNDPIKGILSIPGGLMNERETAEDALRLESQGETSLVLEPVAILGVYSVP